MHFSSFARRRPAFTLIELLISMTITLIMVFALVEFMKYVGDSVTEGRGQIEQAGSLRSVRRQLYRDLQLATVFLRPSPDADTGNGYTEFGDGCRSDSHPTAANATIAFAPEVNLTQDRDLNAKTDDQEGKGPLLGDCDDYAFLTAHSPGNPYAGLFGVQTLTSELAEIAWFVSHFQFDATGTPTATFSDPNHIAECTLYRRVLLIRPDLNTAYDAQTDTFFLPGHDYMTLQLAYDALVDTFWQNNDISVRVAPRTYPTMMGTTTKYLLVANSLSDLSRRENRFAHKFLPSGVMFPAPLDIRPDVAADVGRYVLKGARLGQDVALSHVSAFDLRVYDPAAIVRRDSTGSTVLTPGDPGYTAMGVVDVGQGAFVDLGYGRFFDNGMPMPPPTVPLTAAQKAASIFYPWTKSIVNRAPGMYPAGLVHDPATQLYCTYDSWSFGYEHDGINQDGDAVTDEGTDGLDNDNQFGVDDPGERETLPPYPVLLSGIQIRLRVYDHSIRVGQQATIVAEFTK